MDVGDVCYSGIQGFPRAEERVCVPDGHSASPLKSIRTTHRTEKREKKKPLGYFWFMIIFFLLHI